MLGKFQNEPNITHCRLLQNVLRYLKATADYGIYLPNSKCDVTFEAWPYADWGLDLKQCRYRSGYLVTIKG